MKLIIFMILAFISPASFSQEYATTESGKSVQLNKNGTYKYIQKKTNPSEKDKLSASDFKITEGKAAVFSKEITLKDADENNMIVSVKYMTDESVYKNTTVENINKMISMSNIETMYSLKNKYTYVPKKVFITFDDAKKRWMISIDYTAQNDYGATKDGIFVTVITTDGFVYDKYKI